MAGGSNREFLSSSFTDLMASLAVIFILLTVVFVKNASERSKRDKKQVKEGLAELLAKHKLPIRQDPTDPLTLIVSVDEKLLKFPINSAKLSSAGGSFLDALMPELARDLCTEPIHSRVDAVIIEGHTDRSGENSPAGMRRNIRLSQSRSFAVLDRTLETVQKDSALSECILKLASATGRGSRVPVYVAGAYSPDLSRRVEIKIRVKSTEQELQDNPIRGTRLEE